jgi:surfeit locus 1 family protein
LPGLTSFNSKRWIVVVLIICLWCLLMALGFWQLGRADEKKALLEGFEQRMKMTPVAFDASLMDYSDLRYQRVYVKGHFDGDHQFFLDNQIYKGRAGFHVLTPFVMENTGRTILVDRGWVVANPDRNHLPDISVNEQRMRVDGVLYVPFGKPYLLGSETENSEGWPRILESVDWDVVSKGLGVPVAPVLLRMDKEWEDGLVHEWELIPFGPQKHIAYAVQWFAMATVLLVMSFAVARGRREIK